jgi:hypothetical protein
MEQDRNVSIVLGGMKMDVLMMLYYVAAGRDGRTSRRSLVRGVCRAELLREINGFDWSGIILRDIRRSCTTL